MTERPNLDIFISIMKTAKMMQDLMKTELSKFNLSPTEFSVLEVLYVSGRQTVHEVAERILLAASSMTYVIDKLENRQLLKRSDCNEDRRAVYVELTDGGNGLMRHVYPPYLGKIDDLFSGISDEEKTTIKNVFTKLAL